jgi:hypothetical protein
MLERPAARPGHFHKKCGKVVENVPISNANLKKFLKIRLFAQNLGRGVNLFIMNGLITY